MEKPQFGVWTEPLRALGAMQLLKLAEDRDVGFRVDGCAFWDEVLEDRSLGIKEEAVHELLLRLRPLGLAWGLGSLLRPLLKKSNI